MYEPPCIHLSISFTHINDIIEISMKIAVRNAKLYPRFHTTFVRSGIRRYEVKKTSNYRTCNIVVIVTSNIGNSNFSRHIHGTNESL